MYVGVVKVSKGIGISDMCGGVECMHVGVDSHAWTPFKVGMAPSLGGDCLTMHVWGSKGVCPQVLRHMHGYRVT